MAQTPRDKTETALYDALATFNATAQWDVLRLAQMRQYLAEHLANALVPSWLHERKAETAGEEIAHVLLMVGLMPSDWIDAHRAEVLNEAADAAEMVGSGFFDNAHSGEGNGAMAVAAELRERAAILTPAAADGQVAA